MRLTQPTYLKAIRRGTALVGLGSSDGQVWEQLWGASAGLGTTLQAGLAVISGDTKRGDAIGYARGRFEVWPDPAVATPVVSLAGTATNNTYTYTTKATVTLLAGSATQTLRYTLDGSAPTGTSTLYSAPFDLTTVGDTVLSVRAFEGSNPSGTTVMTIKVVP